MKLSFMVLSLALLAFVSATTSLAATLNVSNGQLMGASDVIVDGSLYDVAFLDESCADLYSGCDSVSDFTFQTLEAAELASQALLDQVFLDVAEGAFDSRSELTNGCTVGNDRDYCSVVTPIAPPTPLGIANLYLLPAGFAQNATTPSFFQFQDEVFSGDAGASTLTTFEFSEWLVFAAWTPVPEPGTALLLGLGLMGLSTSGRNARRAA